MDWLNFNEINTGKKLKKYPNFKSDNKLEEGKMVELLDKDFEFDFKGKPAGCYARGRIIKWYDCNMCLVELSCNGLRYKIDKKILRYL